MTFNMNVASTMINSFMAGWCLSEGPVGLGIICACVALLNGYTVVVSHYNRGT